MDILRDKLVELIRKAHKVCKAYKSCHDCPRYGYGSDCVYLFFADHLIANGVTVQEWIPVTEKLPEESGGYLAYCGEYDGICILYYEVLKTKGRWRSKWKYDVTHWMPLPEPPKGE